MTPIGNSVIMIIKVNNVDSIFLKVKKNGERCLQFRGVQGAVSTHKTRVRNMVLLLVIYIITSTVHETKLSYNENVLLVPRVLLLYFQMSV